MALASPAPAALPLAAKQVKAGHLLASAAGRREELPPLASDREGPWLPAASLLQLGWLQQHDV